MEEEREQAEAQRPLRKRGDLGREGILGFQYSVGSSKETAVSQFLIMQCFGVLFPGLQST